MDACVGKIIDLLADCGISYVKHHGAYVIRYKDKVQLLRDENKRLDTIKDRIQVMVDRATNIGKVIDIRVSSWLEDVEQMEGKIADFLRQLENGESFECFKGCMCPNLIWRYKTGKEADTRKSDVSALISEGAELEKSPVARDPSFRRELKFDSLQYYTMFESRALVIVNIMEALKDSGVDLIGVHGPGGAGKTTMVKEVAKEAKTLGIFDKIVIAVVSKDPNTSKLQKDIATQLDLKYEQKSELGRANELGKALLNGKRKILVILDDLWQELDLNAIGITNSDLGNKGCKILLTSRNKEVFKRMEVHSCFSIGYLEENEAWELFTKVTGEFGVDNLIAREVSKKCGGLPIAIVAVGAALRGEEEFEWKEALTELEKSPLKYIEGVEPKGYTPLKWSYDFLKDSDAKSCFLLCCLFPEDADISIDDLVRYSFVLGFFGTGVDTLEKARNRVKSKVNKLKKSCLLLNGAQRDFVKMHDVIRDLAISITKEKQVEHNGDDDWPRQQQFMVDHNFRKCPTQNVDWEHHTAISLRINDDNFHFPSAVFHCPLMHTLVLKHGEFSLKVSNDFFQGMKGARVLDLEGIVLDLPSLVSKLNGLRMLCLNYCKLLGDVSTIRNLKNHIEILRFRDFTIKELPQEIGELTRLRSLDLRECNRLELIPKGVISNLIHLEELYVAHNFKGWDTVIDGKGMSNASIDELKSLNKLTALAVGISLESSRIMVQKCSDLFEKLTNFYIFINDDFYTNVSTNFLGIEGIHHIDDEFRLLMDKVDELILSNIQDLRYLVDKPKLHCTPSSASFGKLTYLEITKCHSMKHLFSPSCAKTFQQLKRLSVCYCSRMEQIIGVGDHYNEEEVVTDEAIIFSQLESLKLRELPQFRSFYPKMEKTTIEGNPSNWTTTAESCFNEKVSFPILKKLTIYQLSLEDIWNKQIIPSSEGSNKGSFSQLKNMKVIKCHNLVNVFPSNMLPRLQNLKRLCVKDCPSLTLLVENLNSNTQSPTVKSKSYDVFPKLRDLELDNLPKLMKTWVSDEDYYSYDDSVHLYVEKISITSCDSLRHAFSALVARHLARIQVLRIKACPGMEAIVAEARGRETNNGTIIFNELKGLCLEDLPNLKSFYQFKSEASHLFNHQDACPNIETLYLGDVKSTGEIQVWDLATTQKHLHSVSLIGCQVSTKVLFRHVKQSYRMIHLQNCQGFKHVADFEGTISIGEEQFVDVQELMLYDLPELLSLWNENLHKNWGLQNLKHINIRNCPQMKSLLTHSTATTLQHLETIAVDSCEMMEEVIIISEENSINIAGEEQATWHIKFSKLKALILIGLPNLTSFCNDERVSFNFSSLDGVGVENCPKIKTFVSGQICLPLRRRLPWLGDDSVEIKNLNEYFATRNEDSNHINKIISRGEKYLKYYGMGILIDAMEIEALM